MFRPAISCARAIALDVGGSSVKSAVVAPGGRIVAEPAVVPVDSTGSAGSILDVLASCVRGRLAQIDAAHLLGVGLGFPGPFDYATGVCRITDLDKYRALYGLNIGEALRERVDLRDRPILFRNDAEAAIVAEARYGAGRPYRRLVGVTLGTGCGSAFVVNGATISAGEGIPDHGWLYPMPFRGARADDVFSRRGLESRLRAAGAEVSDLRMAAALARAGDTTICHVFSAFGADMGAFLGPFATAFGAEAVLVLGGIAAAFDLFGSALAEELAIPVLPGVYGVHAGLIGAAELLFDREDLERA